MILDVLEQALRQMGRHPGRTLLTSLGVLIGVAAVITMVSIGQGAKAAVEQDVSGLGGNLVFLLPGSQEGMGADRFGAAPFSEDDARAIAGEVPGVRSVAPQITSIAIATRDEVRWRTEVRGSTSSWIDTLSFDLVEGRRFEPGEEAAGSGVCLIGMSVRHALFGSAPALDAAIRLGEVTCRVVGVFGPKGENTFGIDQDDFVLVPLRLMQRRFVGRPDVAVLFVKGEDAVPVARIRADLQDLMDRRRHVRPGADRDYTVRDMAEMVSMLDDISTVLTSFLAAIAGVSLLVGGIGIMNIMLVSVTERTREIGIRLAIGARRRDVLMQFLVEAVLLSAVGGLAGVITAALLSLAITTALDLPLVLQWPIVALALGVSSLVGVVFGFWPAWRAARMKPIDALRHE